MSAAPAMRFCSILLLLIAAPAAGQTTVAAMVEPDVAEVGEMVSFSVEVTGDEADDTVVEPPSATGLSLAQPTPVLRTLAIVRGQARLTVRWLYQAERPGGATIGSARVRVGGRTYTTSPIAVTVTDRGQLAPAIPPPTAVPAPDRAGGELFVRAVPRVRSPYTGQQVVVDYVLYFEPHLEPRSAQFVGSWQAEGLWREELEVPREATAARPVTVDGRRYYAVVLRRVAIYPTRSGDVRLGALTFDLELLRGSRGASPFGFFPRLGARYAHEEVTAPPVELTARALPPGAPAAFSGAVGRFSMTADLDRADARAGEPLQLTVTVEGTGNVATLAPPAVEAPPSFERFEPREDRTLDARRAPAVGTKTFTYSLMPRAAGRHEVGVGFSFFDPDAGAYRTLEAGPFAVAVTGSVLAGAPGSAGPAPPMEDAEWTRARSFSRPGAAWLVAAAFFPLMALALLLVSRRGLRLPKRRRRAAAPDRLAAARAALDDPPVFYTALDTAIAGAAPATPEAQAEAAELKKITERVRYAPGPAPDRAARLAHLARAERLLRP